MQYIVNIISTLYILFLPGFFLSFVFFKPNKSDNIERLVFSFALSIATVPLLAFYANLFGIPITPVTVILIATSIIFIAGIVLLIQNSRHK